MEETGYDISPLIKEKDYVELTIREQRIRLYIVVGVSEDTEFSPKTRKEISVCHLFLFFTYTDFFTVSYTYFFLPYQ